MSNTEIKSPALIALSDAYNRKSLVHIAVDWQTKYFLGDDSVEADDYIASTQQVSLHHNRNSFRRAARFAKHIQSSIPTLWIGLGKETVPSDRLHQISLGNNDAVFWKNSSSGFGAVNFDNYMRSSPFDTLIISGYHSGDCQKKTVLDALNKNYTVIVPTDLVDSALLVEGRNLSWEAKPSSSAMDQLVRLHYSGLKKSQAFEQSNNLYGIKSYEIVQALT